MNLKGYYRRIRELEESLPNEFLVVKSIPTEAGGKAGRLTEVSRPLAAKLLAEGVVELVSPEEAEQFRAGAAEAHRSEMERQQAAQIQFHVISDADLGALKRTRNRGKE